MPSLPNVSLFGDFSEFFKIEFDAVTNYPLDLPTTPAAAGHFDGTSGQPKSVYTKFKRKLTW